jgi:hypothetical protein
MTGIAFCRAPSRGIESLKLEKRELGTIDRGWQDKARKVRAVGWGWVERRIPAIPQTLCSTRRNLRFLARCYCRSAFDTL